MFILTSGILLLTFLSTFRIVFIMPTNFALIFKNIGYNLRIVRFIYNFPYNYKIIQRVVLYRICYVKLNYLYQSYETCRLKLTFIQKIYNKMNNYIGNGSPRFGNDFESRFEQGI